MVSNEKSLLAFQDPSYPEGLYQFNPLHAFWTLDAWSVLLSWIWSLEKPI